MNPDDDFDTDSTDYSTPRVEKGAELRAYAVEAPPVDVFQQFCSALGCYDPINFWSLFSHTDDEDIDSE